MDLRIEKEYEMLRKIPKNLKVRFMELSDCVLAGSADKDRRWGPEIMHLKNFLAVNHILLGPCHALDHLHDRFKRFKAHQQIRQIFEAAET
ncbi:hypothetical protein C4546_02530 [Candidatus Parcubacteria bacterium]|jgi:hypothetical protein|nr:MAG: hypothetical protein C4546_02530 [Candidatus Parcubacteria bacterium]